MKRITVFPMFLLFSVLVQMTSSCSDSDDNSTDDTKIIWEQSVNKECLHKDPFGFGPSSEYYVNIGAKEGTLFYTRYKPLGVERSSKYVDENNNLIPLDYDLGSTIIDSKTKRIYLKEWGLSSTTVYRVDQSTLKKGEKLFEINLGIGINGLKVYDNIFYTVESDLNVSQLVKYDVYKTEKEVIYTFDIQNNERIELKSFYEYDNRLYCSLIQSNSDKPFDFNPQLIQLDLSDEKLVWKNILPKFTKHIQFKNNEMYVFMPEEKTVVFNVKSGDEVRSLPLLGSNTSFVSIVEDLILVRELEIENNYPVSEILNGYRLDNQEELFSIKGAFLAVSNDKVYAYDKNESAIRIISLVDPNFSKRIDLVDILEERKGYTQWQMAHGPNLLLGQDDQCDLSNLILISMP